MGRAPCCDKNGLKKGPWTPEEDQKLIDYIQKHGYGNWRTLPKNAGLQRCGKSCRLRWTNYLRPDIKRGKFSFEEEETIIQLHSILGNKWSTIAARLPGRTDNEIKNFWNTHIRKRLLRMGIDPVTHSPRLDLLDISSILSNSPAIYNNTSSPSNMSRLLGLNHLVNPELLKLATSLLSRTQQNNNNFNPILQTTQIQTPIQNPIPSCTTLTTTATTATTGTTNFEGYTTNNIPNLDAQTLNQWQNNGLGSEDLFNIYGSDQTLMNPSSLSDHSSFMSFGPSVMSTPSSSPTSLDSNSNSNSMFVGMEDERVMNYCSDHMVKFEMPDIVDVNGFMFTQINCS